MLRRARIPLCAALLVLAPVATASALDRDAPRAVAKPDAPIIALGVREPDARLVDLGRALFHDPSLSSNGRVSCATCHPLAHGSTTNEPQSHRGVDGTAVPFNTPSVWSVAVTGRYGWRGDTTKVSDVVERALTRPFTMGNADLAAVTTRLAANTSYAKRFESAGLKADREGVDAALTAYMVHLTPRDTPAERYLAGDRSAVDEAARRGGDLFANIGCIACHSGRGFGGDVVARFGNVVGDPYAERGQCDDDTFCRSDADCAISGGGACRPTHLVRDADKGAHVDGDESGAPTYRFRVPSLLCVGETAPYFHDGSARTLDEAVRVMARFQLGKTLTDAEAADIVAFLKTLTGSLPPDER